MNRRDFLRVIPAALLGAVLGGNVAISTVDEDALRRAHLAEAEQRHQAELNRIWNEAIARFDAERRAGEGE